MSTLDLDSLSAFIAAAELLSFRAASRRVGLSPAAFSERMKRLEEDLGAKLFHRTTRTVTLTPAGLRLLPQAQRCLEESRRCFDVVAEEGHRPPFRLRLGTRYELGLSWLTPALSALREARPERRVDLVFGDSPELLRQLRAGQLDAAVTSIRLSQGELDYALLHPETYCFVGAPELIAERPLSSREEAVEHVLIDAAEDLPLFRYLLDAAEDAEPWPFRDRELLGTIAAVKLRVLEGAGVAVLPEYFVREDLAAGRLTVLLEGSPLRSDAFRLIWRSKDPREDELRELAQALRALPVR